MEIDAYEEGKDVCKDDVYEGDKMRETAVYIVEDPSII